MSALFSGEFEQAASAAGREERQRLLVRAELTDERGATQPVVIRNISGRGLGVTAREFTPVIDEVVTLGVPGNKSVQGVVRWVEGQTFGIELFDMLDQQALVRAISRNAQRSNQQGKWEVRTGHQVRPTQVDPSRLRKI